MATSAANIDLRWSTFIGTPERLQAGIGGLANVTARNIDMRYCNILFVQRDLSEHEIVRALQLTPEARQT